MMTPSADPLNSFSSTVATAFTMNGGAVTAQQFQQTALNPMQSVVIEACAGSGKTWLLVSRILRLLLAGVAPQQILALTFTRKAAQEMHSRLLEVLADWATGENTEVLNDLQARGLSAEQAAQQLPIARGLYEELLQQSHALTLDTFHGWFARILRHAPLAAGIPSDYTLLEHTGRWQRKAWQAFSLQIQRPEHAPVFAAYQALIAQIGAHNTAELLRKVLQNRTEWWAYCDRGGDGHSPAAQAAGIERVISTLRQSAEQTLGFSIPDTAPFPMPLATELVNAVQGLYDLLQAVPPAKRVESIETACHQLNRQLVNWQAKSYAALDQAEFESLCAIFLTKEQAPRKFLQDNLPKKLGPLAERYSTLLDQVLTALSVQQQRVAEWQTCQLNRHVLQCALLLIECYQQLKEELNSLDFSDLEWHVHRLVQDEEFAPYLLARLDARYQHILVDEFQDTNPIQWGILHHWLAACAGAGSRPQVFIVGDPKQSIYRFRRAEPRLFAQVSQQLQQTYGALALRTNQTRRNSKTVTEVLNTVMTAHPNYQPQETYSEDQGGLLLLPKITPIAAPTTSKTHAPNETTAAINQASAECVASRWRDALITPRPEDERLERYQEGVQVAQQLLALLPTLRIVEKHQPSDAQAITRVANYADVMILVPRRSHLAEYERALRDYGIPFLSDRSGGLLNTLEIGDLRALLAWLVHPWHDLALARVLRSPLFGLSDTELFMLAEAAQTTVQSAAPRQSWWQAWQNNAAALNTLQAQQTRLADWLAKAEVLPVHDLLDYIYHQSQALAQYVARVPTAMAAQVQANLHAFLNLALALDAGRYPSLPAFLDELSELEQASAQEAPDEGAESAENAVQILTIHGAKGLEAPIVVLMDSAADQRDEHYDTLIDWPAEASQPVHFSVHLPGSQRGTAQQRWITTAEQLGAQEDWNLLYVALTRARQWLLISGTESRKKSTSRNWYQILEQAAPHSTPLLPLLEAEQLSPITTQFTALKHTSVTHLVQDFFPPSLHIGTRQAPISNSTQRQLQIGIVWHAVLEHLTTNHAANAWQEQAIKPLIEAFDTFGLIEQEKTEIQTATQHVLSAPTLQDFFEPQRYVNARNEMTLIDSMGTILRIDRWVERTEECWILDFKWQVTPAELPAYRKQLLTYVATVQSLYSTHPAQKKLRAGLITRQAELIELDLAQKESI